MQEGFGLYILLIVCSRLARDKEVGTYEEHRTYHVHHDQPMLLKIDGHFSVYSHLKITTLFIEPTSISRVQTYSANTR